MLDMPSLNVEERFWRYWSPLWDALVGHNMEREFRDHIRRYAEPHRYYHTLRHIVSCLDELSAALRAGVARGKQVNISAVQLALIEHDIKYFTDPRNYSGSEEASALYCEDLCRESGLSDSFIKIASQIVRKSNHKGGPCTPNEELALDPDLSILGKPPEVYDLFENQIRREYVRVPLKTFREVRRGILAVFLARPRIYYTDYFFELYEKQARENLARAIEQLTENK